MTQTIDLFTYHWHDVSDEDSCIIRVYGLNKEGETICVNIEGFTPYVYLELDPKYGWDKMKTNQLLKKIKEACDGVIDGKMVRKKKLFFNHKMKGSDGVWEDEKFPYLFLTLKNKRMSHLLEKILRGGISIFGTKMRPKMHEHNATAILQLVCNRKIKTAGWIRVSGDELDEDDKSTTADYEYCINHKDITPLNDNFVPNPIVMGFDIEVNSTNPDRMPQSDVPGDKVFQISASVARLGSDDKKDYLITLGTPNHNVVGEDVEIWCCGTEGELLEAFSDLVQQVSPHVITGYNIFNFDIPYMIDRARRCNAYQIFDQQGFDVGGHSPEKEIKWSSSAYGNQEFKYLDAQGRLYVDLLPLVKRDYKFNNYKLKTISDHFLGETKDPLSVKGIFKCYRIGVRGMEEEDRKEAEVEYNQKIIDQGANALGVVGKYCVQDSALTLKLFGIMKTWIGLVEMAAVTNVPIFILYTQGQQVKVFSQVYRMCLGEYVVEKDGYIAGENERYTGAMVFEPKPGAYDNVVPFDFSSLYPTTIIAYNLCYSTLVNEVIDKGNTPDDMCNVIEWADHQGCLKWDSNITLNNLSVPIEQLVDNKELLLSFDESKNGLIKKRQTHFFDQGVKECVELTFLDGRKITCTPDHRFLISNNNWVEAQDLDVNVDSIKCGYNPPVCDINNEMELCKGLDIIVGDFNIKIETYKDFDYWLRFMRVLGYIITDGSVGEDVALFMGHNIDVESILEDLNVLFGYKPKPRRDENCWIIRLSKPFARKIRSIPGIIIGKKMNQESSLPHFITNDLPLPLVREFLGGMFGGDGFAPCWNEKSKQLSSIVLCQSRNEKYLESLNEMFLDMSNLLNRFDINSTISRPYKQKETNNYQVNINIPISELTKFKEKIDYRFCVHKSQRMEVAYSYYKLRERISQQRNEILTLVRSKIQAGSSIKSSLKEVIKEYKRDNIILNDYYSLPSYDWIHSSIKDGKKSNRNQFSQPHFPSIREYLEKINALEYFKNDDKHCYSVKLFSETLPTFNQLLIGRSNVGKHHTYDIEVKDTHNFIANGCVVHNCEHDTQKRKLKIKEDQIYCKEHRFRFLKAEHGGKGIVPTLLENLLAARKNTRKEQKVIKPDITKLKNKKSDKGKLSSKDRKKLDELETLYDVLEKRQLAFKVSANSVYGAFGTRVGYLPCIPIAMCTTAMGRFNIQKAAKSLQEDYNGTLIYGDTDSCYINFKDYNNKEAHELWDYCLDVSDKISKIFPAPMTLEFEDVIYDRFFILSKKRYICLKKYRDGKIDDSLGIRGVLLTRRDNANVIREMYRQCIMDVFYKKGKEEVIEFVLETLDKIVTGQVKLNEFIITKSVKDVGDYKIKPLPEDAIKRAKRLKDLDCKNEDEYIYRALPSNMQLALKMRKRGKLVSSGQRIEYVITDPMNPTAKLFNKIEDPEHLEEHPEIVKIDPLYYMKMMCTPIDECLGVGFGLEGFMTQQYKLRLNKWKINREIEDMFRPRVELSQKSLL